jgi:hypothetical protein
MDGTGWIRADLMHRADVRSLGDDGLRGDLALLELGALGFFFGLRPVVPNGADEVLNVGKSAYTDPFLVSTLLSVRLPLFPGMRVKFWSNYSNEIAHQVIVGTLDLALTTGVPDNPKLNVLKLADNPSAKGRIVIPSRAILHAAFGGRNASPPTPQYSWPMYMGCFTSLIPR